MSRIACLCLLIIAARPAFAQRWCDSTPKDSVSYSQCALRLEGDYLVRGYRETVAIADAYQPVPLLRFVSGDSAIKYAMRYERDASRSGMIRFVGDLLFLVGNFTALGQRRYSPMHGVTTGRTGPIMMITGASMHLASYPLQWRAEREGDSAVRWNNAGLRRDP